MNLVVIVVSLVDRRHAKQRRTSLFAENMGMLKARGGTISGLFEQCAICFAHKKHNVYALPSGELNPASSGCVCM